MRSYDAIMKNMKQIIIEKLAEIEQKENVKILHCVESGSRAWGFPSADSDYDVRFIYVRPRDFYLSLNQTRDVIEWQLDETLDISGWDLSKALTLLHRSNSTLFEWSTSPIVYQTTEEWAQIAAVINRSFVAKSGLYHYLSTAKHHYREFLTGETVKLKKYFYVLRPLFACNWILAEGNPPPMLFSELAERYAEEEIKPELAKLLALKKQLPELGEGKRNNILNDYIERTIPRVEQAIAAMPSSPACDWGELNGIFCSVLNQNEEMRNMSKESVALFRLCNRPKIDLKEIEAFIIDHKVTPADITYAAICLLAENHLEIHGFDYTEQQIPSPDELVSTNWPELFDLFIRHGLYPNLVQNGDSVISALRFVDNGDVAPIVMRKLLESGGDPNMTVDGAFLRRFTATSVMTLSIKATSGCSILSSRSGW